MPWDRWADGRVWRLAKGRDFLRSADSVAEAAANAAARLGKFAITVEERRPGNTFVWVQFVDRRLEAGEPCPCGQSRLRRVNRQIALCESCGSTIVIHEPKVRREAAAPGDGFRGERQLRALLDGSSVPASPGRTAAPSAPVVRTKVRDPRKDLTMLGPFREIALARGARNERRDRFFGRALGPGDRRWLLVVDFALVEARWVRSDDHPGGWRHNVWAVPLETWRDIVDVGRLDALETELVIDDPFVDDYSDAGLGDPGDADEEGAEAPSATEVIGPPSSAADLDTIALFAYATNSEEIERYRGVATAPTGERLLVTVHFRLQDGQRRIDPQTGDPQHDLAAMPLEPFRGIVDQDPFEGLEPDVTLGRVRGSGARSERAEVVQP